MTSRRNNDANQAQPSLKDTAPAGLGSAGPAQSPTRIANEAMESESNNNNNKKNNAITSNVPEKNMEVEAATKIQAGFRGYQVRKQLKAKVSFSILYNRAFVSYIHRVFQMLKNGIFVKIPIIRQFYEN